jgi:hypothetical protein
MQKDKLWGILLSRNPQFTTGPVTFTAKGLKKFFNTVWDKGHAQGVLNGKAISEEQDAKHSSKVPDFFSILYKK